MKVLIIGSGMMAKAAAFDLVKNNQLTSLNIASNNLAEAQDLKNWLLSDKVSISLLDARSKESSSQTMTDRDVAISCVPYKHNFTLATAAIASRTHFIDLGGNNDIVAKELQLHDTAKKAGILIVPDCGLAPGLVSIFTKQLIEELGEVDSIHLRVGGLPQTPHGLLNYEKVFSIKGLINEYIEPVTLIKNYKEQIVEPLEELEEISFPSPYGPMEAFTTSGGTSTLCKSYAGTINTLDYKTIRYKGHLHALKKLIIDHPPFEALEHKLNALLNEGKEDVVFLKAWAIKEGRRYEYEIIDKYDAHTQLTAMMRTTAFPATVLASLICQGEIRTTGAQTQEHFAPAATILQELKQRGIAIKKNF